MVVVVVNSTSSSDKPAFVSSFCWEDAHDGDGDDDAAAAAAADDDDGAIIDSLPRAANH